MKAIRRVILLMACAVLPAMGFAQDAVPATPAPAPQPPSALTPLDLQAIEASRQWRFTTPLPVRPLAVTPTLGLPFSADGLITTTHRLADGTRIEQRTNAKLFRDSAGRVRREQSIVGLTQAALPVVTITDPTAAVSYTLDSRTRTAYRAPLQAYVRSGGMPVSSTFYARYFEGRVVVRPEPPAPRPEGPDDVVGVIPAGTGSRTEMLTTQQIAGLWSTGTRTKVTLRSGMVGNDRPFDVTTERWTATDLNVVVLSRSNDPRVGTTEYQLTNVVRVEPPAALFVVPTGYRVVDTVARPADAAR